MNALLLVLSVFGGSGGLGGTDLLRDAFDAAMETFHVTSGDAFIDQGALVVKEGRVESTRPVFGDLSIELVARLDAGARLALEIADEVQVRIESEPEPRLGLSRGGRESVRKLAGLPLESFVLRVVSRGGALEAWIDGRPVADLLDRTPLGGGAVAIAVDNGAVRIDEVVVKRLAWSDVVHVEGADTARIDRLAGLPLERFRLLDPPPSRIDAEYRVAIDGEADAPITVRTWGVRRPAEEIPLLEQALAEAGIRPYLAMRVTELDEVGEDGRTVAGEGPFGPFTVTGAVRVEVDALLGIRDEWPSLVLYDVVNDRFLDRVVPGGPAARPLMVEVSEEIDHLRVDLVVPGREMVSHDVRLIRP